MLKKTVRKNHLGYSLIEIIIVIFIMTLISGLGIVNYRNYQAKRRFDGYVSQIYQDLKTAQSLAVAGVVPSTSCKILKGYLFNRYSGGQNYSIEALCDNGSVVTHCTNTSNPEPSFCYKYSSVPADLEISIPAANRVVVDGVEGAHLYAFFKTVNGSVNAKTEAVNANQRNLRVNVTRINDGLTKAIYVTGAGAIYY